MQSDKNREKREGVVNQYGNDSSILRLKQVNKSFNGDQVLDNVSLDLKHRDLLGLIGPSGGGKSVLLKLIAGVYPPDKGMVDFDSGMNVSTSFMFQEGALFDSLNVLDNVAFSLLGSSTSVSNLPRRRKLEVWTQVLATLSKVGLREAVFKYPAELSGGMRKRVSLARAIADIPMLLLLDEPTSGLDPIASNVILDLIKNIHDKEGLSTIIVSHDLRRLIPLCDQLVFLGKEGISFRGTLEELRSCKNQEILHFIRCRYEL